MATRPCVLVYTGEHKEIAPVLFREGLDVEVVTSPAELEAVAVRKQFHLLLIDSLVSPPASQIRALLDRRPQPSPPESANNSGSLSPAAALPAPAAMRLERRAAWLSIFGALCYYRTQQQRSAEAEETWGSMENL